MLPLPSAKSTEDDDVIIKHFADLYGYRGPRQYHKELYIYIFNVTSRHRRICFSVICVDI